MDQISDGCRLCLDPFAECFTTIDNPQLKDQMKKVFCFSIEPKQNYCSGVCQSCSYAISEFYQYSEKVRLNQEVLNGNVTNCDPTEDSKIVFESYKVAMLSGSGKMIEPTDEVRGEEKFRTADPIKSVKVETLSDSGLPETTEEACELLDGVFGEEEAPNSDEHESLEHLPKKSQSKRKRWPGKSQLDDVEADEPRKNIKTKQELYEEDQLFNEHFRMICNLCGSSSATYTELVSHFRKEHKRRDGYVVCCNRKLFKRNAIRDHIDYHANPDVFRCAVCGNRYKTKDNLNAHMLSKHPSAGPFKCYACPNLFAEKPALDEHMKRHVKLNCPKCNKIFICKKVLSKHMTRQHSRDKATLVCDTCGKKFRDKACFDRHMNEHMGIELKRFQCNICQRWLKGEKYLRVHMNTVHADGDQEFQCDICLQKYRHSRALYNHKTRTHAEPKYECEFCGKKFKRATALKEHRTEHTGEVLYPCEYCGIPNNHKWKLRQHIQRKHPMEWAQMKLKGTETSDPS